MSEQSTVSRVSEQSFHSINCCGNVIYPNNFSIPLVLLKFGMKSREVVIYSLFIALALTPWKVKAQCIEVKLPFHMYNLSLLQSLQLGGKEQLYGVGNSIEFIKPVPGEGTLIAVPQPEAEGYQRPDKHNQGRVGIEQQNKLTPDDTHKFWRLLLTQLLAFAAVFPAGVYISMRRNIHRDWRNSIPKGRLPKMPVMGILSISCLPRQIKSRRWLLWEQRSRFIDMKVCKGLENAYLSIWRWKKLVAEKW
ncbi:hypothetical protein R8O69_003334 [Klebsiella oxytoca]|nr:hypothetical protein [Klebsiella oxytoca]ELT9977644.1 hypothetical protein [Klebsiella oxytoca]